MSYNNAEKYLPKHLLEKIQEYVDGECIYIPKKQINKKPWGEGTDTKRILSERNAQIYKKYKQGQSIIELKAQFFLSDKSIQRIILQQKRKIDK